MFADDVSLYTTGKTLHEVEEKLQNIVDEANDWYVANRLAINTSKSNTMLIGTGQRLSDTDGT